MMQQLKESKMAFQAKPSPQALGDLSVRGLIHQEERYNEALKRLNRNPDNPSLRKEVDRLFFILCQGWDAVKKYNS